MSCPSQGHPPLPFSMLTCAPYLCSCPPVSCLLTPLSSVLPGPPAFSDLISVSRLFLAFIHAAACSSCKAKTQHVKEWCVVCSSVSPTTLRARQVQESHQVFFPALMWDPARSGHRWIFVEWDHSYSTLWPGKCFRSSCSLHIEIVLEQISSQACPPASSRMFFLTARPKLPWLQSLQFWAHALLEAPLRLPGSFPQPLLLKSIWQGLTWSDTKCDHRGSCRDRKARGLAPEKTEDIFLSSSGDSPGWRAKSPSLVPAQAPGAWGTWGPDGWVDTERGGKEDCGKGTFRQHVGFPWTPGLSSPKEQSCSLKFSNFNANNSLSKCEAVIILITTHLFTYFKIPLFFFFFLMNRKTNPNQIPLRSSSLC